MSVVYWAVLWTLLLPLTVGAHNERRARRPPRLQSAVADSTSARPLFGVYRRAPNPAGGRAVAGTACTARAGSLLVGLTVCHTQRKKADARAPANGRALAFVDDKLKHVHSPLPPLAYIPVTIDPTCTMPVCLAMTFGNFGVFSGPFSQAIARCRYDCQFRIYILSIQFLELKYCGLDDMISLKLHFIIHLKYITGPPVYIGMRGLVPIKY
jgi:hypothetical protein